MRKILIILILCFMCTGLTRCKKSSSGGCDGSSPNRVGAMCNDGTRTNSVDSGACSDHGGVEYWICQ